ncbi:MAG: hypothetical protein ALECFALPRED_008944 [Alectoria fallacina]|uniref:D-mandelate dehydrogenase n=1 Tax=Alectoria fallacina TaxID=1903189 RepID=A0A8H3J5I4_9LECA|nr:MAG: hypothetical protein ALECFALPRED_008944 [Alectoria fallacina]
MGSTAHSSSDTKHIHTSNHKPTNGPITKPIILHLGEPVRYNRTLHSQLSSKYEIIRPLPSSLQRSAFKKHLGDKTWGDFSAIMRPFWNTGGEMGNWDRELIELLPTSMQVMASAGAGFDWVDTGVLAEFGILYCNGAHASTESVALMALYHIISVFRHMTWSSLAARSNDAAEWTTAHQQIPFRSHNPEGHTLGIIGLGNIGHAIAKKVKAALGMKIIYYDVIQKTPELEREVDATFYPSKEEMLRASDCVLIATPHTGRPVLDAYTLSLLPAGARVVNIARGVCIDEDALADALESKHISAAGLDVHAQEPRVSERLSKMFNVTLTCHTGGGSIETAVGFEKLVMQNVEAVLEGREALTAVNQRLVDGHASRDREPTNGVKVNGETRNADGSVTNGETTNGTRKAANGTASTAVGNT